MRERASQAVRAAIGKLRPAVVGPLVDLQLQAAARWDGRSHGQWTVDSGHVDRLDKACQGRGLVPMNRGRWVGVDGVRCLRFFALAKECARGGLLFLFRLLAFFCPLSL